MTRNAQHTHRFYTHAMGFELVKTVVNHTPEGGWAKHFFYATGGGELMAFWELHDDAIETPADVGLSSALGLPEWVNHVAFGASDVADLDVRRQRLVDHGYDVLEIDHGWCRSIYTRDPNGTLVEFCTTTKDFDDADRAAALAALHEAKPEIEPPGPKPKLHRTDREPVHLREG